MMEVFSAWLHANWFSALQAAGICGALCYNAYSLMLGATIRKVELLIKITEQHRAIWLKFIDSPSLRRVNSEHADLEKNHVSDEEALFVNLIILHLMTVLFAIKKGILPKLAGLDEDIQDLFSLPIPRAVWEKTKAFRDPAAIRYIDDLLNSDI